MNRDNRIYKSSIRKNLLYIMILTGLLAGLLDGIAAIIQYSLSGADNPLRVFNFVASGVFGEAALSGGGVMTLLGVVFHLVIATIWTALYFTIYPAVQQIFRHWFVTGLLYGAFVWTCMNLIVLPLSKTPPLTFTMSRVIVGMAIIMICVGLPIAYFANNFFSKED